MYKTTTPSTIEGSVIEITNEIIFIKTDEFPAIVNKIEKLLANILITGSAKRPTIPETISDGKTAIIVFFHYTLLFR